jgi:hypothetical protein
MKKRLIFLLCLLVVWMLQHMTTDFSGLGLKWQATFVLGVMFLSGMAFAIGLSERARAIGGLVPFLIASALLAGPWSTVYGPFLGWIMAITVGSVGAILFRISVVRPFQSTTNNQSVDNDDIARQHAIEGLSALAEMNRRQRTRPKRPWNN